MQVNFTGFINTAYHSDKSYPTFYDEDGNLKYSQEHYVQTDCLNTQLSDDKNGRDLSDFYEALAKSEIKDAKNPLDPRFVNFAIVEAHPDTHAFQFIMNNKYLEINDENIPIISFISKLLKGISNGQEADFDVTHEYVEDPNTPNKIILGLDIRDNFSNQEDFQNYMEYIHDPDVVKDGSASMLDHVTQKMIDYFS